MYYEFNISKDGQHFFATAPRSGNMDKRGAESMYRILCRKFPAWQGYHVTCTLTEICGTRVDFEFAPAYPTAQRII